MSIRRHNTEKNKNLIHQSGRMKLSKSDIVMRNAHFLRHADRLNPAMEDKVKEYLAWRKKHNISGYDLYEMLWRAVKRPRKEEFKITDEWVKENFDNKIVENAKPEAIAGYMVLTCQDLIDKRIATLKGEGK